MSDRSAVLFANEAFYAAFASRDLAAMAKAWAEAAPVSCIHPGWDALHGRGPVIESWRAILEGASPPDIRCRGARASIYGKVATVVCFEEIGGNYLIATNVFVQESGHWRMVHHQAGPTNGAPPPEPPAQLPS